MIWQTHLKGRRANGLTVHWSSLVFTTSTPFVISCLFLFISIITILTVGRLYLNVVWIGISLMVNDVHHYIVFIIWTYPQFTALFYCWGSSENFSVFATTHNAVIYILVLLSWRTRHIPSRRELGWGLHMFSSPKECQTVFQSGCVQLTLKPLFQSLSK